MPSVGAANPLDALLDLATGGLTKIFALQLQAVAALA